MAWTELRREDLAEWNGRLLEEPGASIRQLPLFNEGLRGSGGLWVSFPGRFAPLIAWGRRRTTTPRYLVHRSASGEATAFACIVSIGVPGARVGCILDGPVSLRGCLVESGALGELVEWARRRHYIALRVTHPKEAFVQEVSRFARSERVDGVPFYPHPASELYVELQSEEAAMLSGFQAVARRNIRKAQEVGYEISVDEAPESIEKVWSVFQSRSEQKGISYRAAETYARMMREARPHRAAHLFTAWRSGAPIATILILRDRTTAHYFLGAIDTDALGDAPSPACLLHWVAMRHALEMGASAYNLGTRSGPVYTFKAKFRPEERESPTPVTLVVNGALYQAWRRLLPAVARVVA
jgi:hypothetical protein